MNFVQSNVTITMIYIYKIQEFIIKKEGNHARIFYTSNYKYYILNTNVLPPDRKNLLRVGSIKYKLQKARSQNMCIEQ